ncbi:hypothetical protein JGU71_18510 [Antrihabitans sp. YC3-6]|uniref:Secreted protein n=1 Tax=Antrihabitans stalagmiti TaxID=2799499 RepID=A0A934NTG9_9NOCA|nr:hypothetical protein [Antrihabitans stalagmiti]MBJ8340880.1 hypothetical protein [Antrihabitans stalagmiti]
MRRTRGTRRAITALAIAAAAAMAAPGVVSAEPIPAVPAIPQDVPIDALASLAPAILGAAAGPMDIAEGPQGALIEQLKLLQQSPALPEQLKSTLDRIIKFLDGSGGGGPAIPPSDGPVISQFLYPTIGRGCISDTADSVGTALAVAGPAKLPPPGPAAGQAGFVFTALGTKTVADTQGDKLTVTWLNIDNRKTLTQPLTNASKINPDGPATLSAIADTGPGRVLAVVSGSLTTQAADAAPRTCTFLPTVGMFSVA